MRRRLALPLLVGLLAAVWAGPAAAAPRGRAPAGVDFDDRDSLYERMDGRS